MKEKINYLDNNGKHVLGCGNYKFTTKWSKASNVSIHFYNDTLDIKRIALAENALRTREENTPFKEVVSKLNLAKFDYTSRCRTLALNDVAIFKNIKDKYLFIKAIKITDSSRDDNDNTLEFEYSIKDVPTTKLFFMSVKALISKKWLTIFFNIIFSHLGDFIDIFRGVKK